MLRFVQNDRVLVWSHGLEICAIRMRYEMRGARCEVRGRISITKFTKYRWNDGVFEGSKEHRRCFGKRTVFFFLNAKIFFILIIFLSEQSENSLANCWSLCFKMLFLWSFLFGNNFLFPNTDFDYAQSPGWKIIFHYI